MFSDITANDKDRKAMTVSYDSLLTNSQTSNDGRRKDGSSHTARHSQIAAVLGGQTVPSVDLLKENTMSKTITEIILDRPCNTRQTTGRTTVTYYTDSYVAHRMIKIMYIINTHKIQKKKQKQEKETNNNNN